MPAARTPGAVRLGVRVKVKFVNRTHRPLKLQARLLLSALCGMTAKLRSVNFKSIMELEIESGSRCDFITRTAAVQVVQW